MPADAVEPVDRVMELSRLSADMIDGLLRYARRPTAAFDSTADLGEVAEWVISVLQDDIASVEAAVDIGPLPIVVGHPAAIRQVLFNLVSNSLRYRHPDRMPLVTIGSVAGDERLVVEVVDNGLGIDERDRERIFEWGYRGSATSATAGTGLGLAACRAALANTGAEIALGPAPAGGGTAMVLRFTSPT